MTRIVTNAGTVGDHSHDAYRRDAEGADQQDEEPSAAAGADEPDEVRLIIEGDEAGTGFTYTTINRRTGEVIQQLPRDGLLELGRTPGYAAGALIKVRV